MQFERIGIAFFADQRNKAGNIDRGRAGALARSANQSGTDAGGTFFVANVLFVLLTEVANR